MGEEYVSKFRSGDHKLKNKSLDSKTHGSDGNKVGLISPRDELTIDGFWIANRIY
jgi:hypothetical protein